MVPSANFESTRPHRFERAPTVCTATYEAVRLGLAESLRDEDLSVALARALESGEGRRPPGPHTPRLDQTTAEIDRVTCPWLLDPTPSWASPVHDPATPHPQDGDVTGAVLTSPGTVVASSSIVQLSPSGVSAKVATSGATSRMVEPPAIWNRRPVMLRAASVQR